VYRGKISRTLPLKERKVKDRNGKDSLAEFEKLDKELKGVKNLCFYCSVFSLIEQSGFMDTSQPYYLVI